MFNKISIIVSSIILTSLLFSFLFFAKERKEDRLLLLSDHIISNFRDTLSYEMANLLSFSLALSQDGELKKSLIDDNENRGYEILSNITKRFKKYTNLKSLRMQVLTTDFFIFARSWNQGFEGMPIWWFRDDLNRLKINISPKVGVETGRLLTFKATIPIQGVKEILGYLEVIKLIDEFALKLRKSGVELFALMDKRYLKKASLMRDFPYVNSYIIANQNYNRAMLSNIKTLDWTTLKDRGYLYKDSFLYLLESMYNGEGKSIGEYLLVVHKDDFDRYDMNNKSLFTQFSNQDIKEVVESFEYPYFSFNSSSDRDLIAMLPKLKPEDKKDLELEAKKILESYTKSQLIDIILHNNHQNKKVGEIE
jgi:hypothetical protein